MSNNKKDKNIRASQPISNNKGNSMSMDTLNTTIDYTSPDRHPKKKK